MNLRATLQRLLPVWVVRRLWQWRAGTAGLGKWTGVYSSFGDAAGTIPAPYTEDNSVVSSLLDHMETVQVAHERPPTFVPYYVAESYTFMPLAAALIPPADRALRVLDVGGGLGVGYLALRACAGESRCGEYRVVETELICRKGSSQFAGDSRIVFSVSMPESGPFDMVYINSALQYFSEPLAILRQVCGYQASYVFLGRLSAGENPDFVSQQHMSSGRLVPFYFLNVEAVVAFMKAGGYDLLFKGAAGPVFDQTELPVDHRMKQACNLLFVRSGAGIAP